MKVMETELPGVVVIEPRVFADERGYFMETWHGPRYADHGIHGSFAQDNLSFSVKGTLRGLHYQIRHPQAKLVQVIRGEVLDVAVDLRPESPFFGRWTGIRLSGENHWQMFIPEGFAHGFCVLSDTAHFSYKCSGVYMPEDEGGIRWSDPDIGIDWPIAAPIVSAKDRRLPRLKETARSRLPSAPPLPAP